MLKVPVTYKLCKLCRTILRSIVRNLRNSKAAKLHLIFNFSVRVVESVGSSLSSNQVVALVKKEQIGIELFKGRCQGLDGISWGTSGSRGCASLCELQILHLIMKSLNSAFMRSQ